MQPIAPEAAFLDDGDALAAFHAAATLLQVEGYDVEARFYPYAGLKSTAYVDRAQRRITGKVSDGLKAASREALLGLALDLTAKLFRKQVPENARRFVEAYHEAFHGKPASSLHDSLRKSRGRKRGGKAQGKHVNLEQVLENTWTKYAAVLEGLQKPSIHWSKNRSRRRLAFYDSAFHDVVVSKRFDREDAPSFFLEYLVFHELLHAKHDIWHGKRARIHHRQFKKDERQFEHYEDAQQLLRAL